MSNLVDNASLLQQIKQLLASGQSGTLFITTENNRSLTLTFENGLITGISSRGLLHGARALVHLAEIERGSYTIDSKVIGLPGGAPDPLDVSKILGLLSKVEASGTAPGVGAPPIQGDFHNRACKIIEEHLAEAVGPFAAVAMKDLCKTLPHPLEGIEEASAAVRKLAKEVDSEEQSREFIKLTLDDLLNLYRSTI